MTDELAALRAQLAAAIMSHQRQNARMAALEDVFCDKHLDELPPACPACAIAEARRAALEEAAEFVLEDELLIPIERIPPEQTKRDYGRVLLEEMAERLRALAQRGGQ